MRRKCLTEITLKQLQFSPTLTGKHNLIGMVKYQYTMYFRIWHKVMFLLLNDGTYKRPKSEL